MIRYLNKNPQDIVYFKELTDNYGMTLLNYLCDTSTVITSNSRIDLINNLLFKFNYQTIVNKCNKYGYTPLHNACALKDIYERYEIIEMLLHAGAVYNTVNIYGELPIHILCYYNCGQYATYLFSRLTRPYNNQQTDIITDFNSLYLSNSLISCRTKLGRLPLHVACQALQPIEVLKLLYRPEFVHLYDNFNKTPLYLICEHEYSNRNYDIVDFLLSSKDVQFKMTRDDYLVCLHCAITNNQEYRVIKLIQDKYLESSINDTNDTNKRKEPDFNSIDENTPEIKIMRH